MALELQAIITIGVAGAGAWWHMNNKMNSMNREIGESKVMLRGNLKNFNGMRKSYAEHLKESQKVHSDILNQLRNLNGDTKK